MIIAVLSPGTRIPNSKKKRRFSSVNFARASMRVSMVRDRMRDALSRVCLQAHEDSRRSLPDPSRMAELEGGNGMGKFRMRYVRWENIV